MPQFAFSILQELGLEEPFITPMGIFSYLKCHHIFSREFSSWLSCEDLCGTGCLPKKIDLSKHILFLHPSSEAFMDILEAMVRSTLLLMGGSCSELHPKL